MATYWSSTDGTNNNYTWSLDYNNRVVATDSTTTNTSGDSDMTIMKQTIERLERRIVELEGNARKRPSFIDFHFLKEKKEETGTLLLDGILSNEDLNNMLNI